MEFQGLSHLGGTAGRRDGGLASDHITSVLSDSVVLSLVCRGEKQPFFLNSRGNGGVGGMASTRCPIGG